MSDTWRVLLVAFFIVVWPNLTPAATSADQAVFNVMHGADPTLVNRKALYRHAVASDLDLVIAIGSPADAQSVVEYQKLKVAWRNTEIRAERAWLAYERHRQTRRAG